MYRKMIAVSLVTASMIAATMAVAQVPAPPKPPKAEPPPLQDVTITGIIVKSEKANKEGKISISYSLTDKDGNSATLNQPKPNKKGGAAVINLEDFLGVEVMIMGKGTERVDKKGKRKLAIRDITTITKMAPAVATPAAQAAPAPAPAPAAEKPAEVAQPEVAK